jgi:hypothetical protein
VKDEPFDWDDLLLSWEISVDFVRWVVPGKMSKLQSSNQMNQAVKPINQSSEAINDSVSQRKQSISQSIIG